MPELYASTLGVPFRAVIVRASGERAFVRIGERADDDFALDPTVWVDQYGAVTGAQAAVLERSGAPGRCYRWSSDAGGEDVDDAGLTRRDLLAAVLRRLVNAAENQSGESIQRIVCVVPPDAGDEARSMCVQAALLAGAQLADAVAPSGSDVLLEAWDDSTRLTLGSHGSAARTVDLSATLARAAFRSLFRQRVGLPDGASEAQVSAVDALFDAWATGKDVGRGMTTTLPAARGAPVVAHATAAVFGALDAALRDRLRRAFEAQQADLATITSFDVAGSWTVPFARAIRAMAGSDAAVHDGRGVDFDRAIAACPPRVRAEKPVLRSDVFAMSESPRTLRALAQGDPVPLLNAGARLPATSISESFKSSSFMGAFRIVAQRDGAALPLMTVPIPRYAERQADSYLRTVIHADTSDLMFIEIAYLYSARRRFAFVDKSAGREDPLSDHVFRMIRG